MVIFTCRSVKINSLEENYFIGLELVTSCLPRAALSTQLWPILGSKKYIYLHIFLYLKTFVYIYIYIYKYIFLNLYCKCIYIRMYLHRVYIYTYIDTYSYTYVFISIYIYSYITYNVYIFMYTPLISKRDVYMYICILNDYQHGLQWLSRIKVHTALDGQSTLYKWEKFLGITYLRCAFSTGYPVIVKQETAWLFLLTCWLEELMVISNGSSAFRGL